MTPEWREAQTEALAKRLDTLLGQHLGSLEGVTLGVYWPIRGEPDLRALFERWHRQGAVLALPVVDSPGRPLRFVRWAPTDVLQTGLHAVPVPPEDEAHPGVSPEILVIPCVGFDAQGYRLGYGGGYYDRTLAHDDKSMPPDQRARAFAPSGRRPVLTLGVAWSEARLHDFEPSPTDVPLDRVVTPDETVTPPR